VYNLHRLTKKGIHDLLVRAGEFVGRMDLVPGFEVEAIKESLNQPRPLLNAFGNHINGMSAVEAVNGQLQTFGAKPNEIALAVVYGDWDKQTSFTDKKTGKEVVKRAAKDLFNELEAEFKKRKKDAAAEDTEETADSLEEKDEDAALGRPDVSRAIRAIAASMLKGAVLKGNTKAVKALSLMAGAISPNPFDAALEYSLTVGLMYRINQTMLGKPY
jgi:hypothetical protein